MDVYLEICKALVGLVKEGGTIGLWGLAIWLGFGLIKIGLIGGLIWACIRLVSLAVLQFLSLRFLTHKDSVSILSKQASKHLMDSVKHYQDSTQTAMKDFMKDAKDLLEKSKAKTK